jgi:hypothetical protein
MSSGYTPGRGASRRPDTSGGTDNYAGWGSGGWQNHSWNEPRRTDSSWAPIGSGQRHAEASRDGNRSIESRGVSKSSSYRHSTPYERSYSSGWHGARWDGNRSIESHSRPENSSWNQSDWRSANAQNTEWQPANTQSQPKAAGRFADRQASGDSAPITRQVFCSDLNALPPSEDIRWSSARGLPAPRTPLAPPSHRWSPTYSTTHETHTPGVTSKAGPWRRPSPNRWIDYPRNTPSTSSGKGQGQPKGKGKHNGKYSSSTKRTYDNRTERRQSHSPVDQATK